ncbi:MAG: hypothetical protein ACF8R9_10610 [Phycisphaerales bacterium JB054]
MTGSDRDRPPALHRARQRLKTWTRRIVVLTTVGLLVQVGFLVCRVQTQLGMPTLAGPVTLATTDRTTDIFVKEHFGATECFSAMLFVRDGTVNSYRPGGIFLGVVAAKPALPERPVWYTLWTDDEVREYSTLLPPIDTDRPLAPVITIIRVGVGYPFKCFSGARVFHGQVDPRGGSSLFSPSTALRSPGFVKLGSMELPVKPIWPGLLLNIAIVAVPVLVLLGVRDVWRWFHRARAGECTGCRYDLSGVPDRSRCPECGLERVA